MSYPTLQPLEPRRLLASISPSAELLNHARAATIESSTVKRDLVPARNPSTFADVIPPTGTLSSAPRQTTPGARYYQYTLTYTDNVAMNVRSFDAWDTLVTDPHGVRRYAAVLRISAPTNGTPRSVTYMVKAPGGRFDPADNGVYTISLRKQQVADTAANKNAGRILGQFSVAITPIASSVASMIRPPTLHASIHPLKSPHADVPSISFP